MSYYNNLLSNYFAKQEDKKRLVWAKGIIIPGREHEAYWVRWDAYYTEIHYNDHGNRDALYGWEMDHYPIPAWLGGSDDVSNLRPLHHRNNTALGPLSGLGAFHWPGEK
jgi:hypothetical protein